MQNQLQLENDRFYKEQMKHIMRQEDQMVVFNSSSPRFQDTATHQIRVLPGKDSIAGINFRVKNDKPIGPGAYASPDEVDHMAKIKTQLRHNRPEGLAFGSVNDRSKNDF